jgi:hypothetical protein
MESERHKRCFKCGETKSLSLFYKHPRMADGHVNKCKDCNKKDVRENRADKSDYYIEYDKRRGKDYESERYKKKLEYGATYRKEQTNRRKAQSLLGSRVRLGHICKSENCEYCGSSENIHGHHSSYSEDMWLIVTWLCAKCHNRLHKDFEYQIGPWEINSDALINR